MTTQVDKALLLVAKVCCDAVSSFHAANGLHEPDWDNASDEQRDLFIDIVKANMESPQPVPQDGNPVEVYTNAMIMAITMTLSPIVVNAVVAEQEAKESND